MKKLFKNSFFSFFKNKLAIALLMIIVFLTTMTFTLFNSATHAFKRSYDEVMTEGNRHDYTIKEMYAAPGDVIFTKPQPVAGEKVSNSEFSIKTGASNVKTINGKEYVLFEAQAYFEGDLFNGNVPVPINNPSNIVIGMTLDDITNFKKNGTQLDASLINVDVDFGAGPMPIPATSIASVDSTATIAAKLPIKPSEPMMGISSFPVHVDANPFDFKVNLLVQDASEFNTIFNKAVNDGTTLVQTEAQTYSFTLERNAKAFSDENKDAYYNIAHAEPEKYTFKFTLPTTFDPAVGNFDDPNLKFKIVQQTANETITDNFATLKEWQDSLTDRLQLKYRDYMHQNVIKSITSHPELVYKDVQSFKVTDKSNTFKFVLDNPNAQVDKMKIFQGDQLPVSLDKDSMFAKWQKDIPYLMQSRINALQKEIDVLMAQKEEVRLKIESSQEYKDFVAKRNAVSTTASDYTNQLKQLSDAFYAIPWVAEANKQRDDLLDKMASVERKRNDNTKIMENLAKPTVVNNNTTFYTGWSTFYTDAFSTYRVIDPSAFAAVVSPTYASNNSIKPISKSTFDHIVNSDEFRLVFSDSELSFIQVKERLEKIAKDNGAANSIIWAGKTPYFTVGVGITPDFAFPIISSDQPIPDTQTQAIVYTNNAGFLRNKDANPGALTENYIALGFDGKVSDQQKEAIINSLKSEVSKYISWPTGINAIEKYDSSTESVLLTPSRITFLENLNHTISMVSWIVTSLLVLFTGFIVALVIKKQIDNRKKQLGILMANGYSKLEIASSMMMIGLIVAVIPAFAGYITGHFMQFALMDIFHNYWTLPIWHTQFSWLTLVITVVAPLAGMSLLAFIISLWSLRGRIPEILAGESAKSGFITRNAMKPMKYFGIKTKMGVSLIFSNVGKLTIAFIAFGASIIAMSVSINSVGKFDYARQQSESATDYEYQVDLVTPTYEGGLYSAQTLDNIYFDKTGAKQSTSGGWQSIRNAIVPLDGNDVDHRDDSIYIHVASIRDAEFAAPSVTGSTNRYPQYLKNRIQTKTLLNLEIQTNTNPWQIASQMMPENQKNTADLNEDKFIDYAVKAWKEDGHAIPSYIIDNKVDNESGIRYKLPTNATLYKDPATSTFASSILDIYSYGLYKATEDRMHNEKSAAPLPYMMSYNNVLLDKTDETYTHIDIKFAHENVNGSTKAQDLKIRGIDKDKLLNHTSKINLSDDSIKALSEFASAKNNGIVPIVINKYFREYYGLTVGDKFTNKIDNSTQRFINETKHQEQPELTFQIVGVENTFNEGKVYTLQSYANQAIGLTDLMNASDANQLAKNQYGAFNGVMTSKENKSPLIFDSLPLYSPSGVYPGKNNISINNKNEDGYVEVSGAYFAPGKSFAKNPDIKDMDTLIQIYGNGELMSPMQSLYSTVDWTKVSDYQFNSIMSLASALMNTVQIIVMFIALAFVLLISTMIIADNTKFIATLKVMGYRTREISRIFLATFIPSLIFALVVSVPIVFGLEEAIRVGIMGFGHVLIPLYIVGWEIAFAFGLLVIGFLAMYFISLRGLKNTSLLKAFQE